MGNTCNRQTWDTQNQLEPVTEISRYQFDFQYIIGRGAFGKVWRVEQKKGQQILAMKEMSKSKIIAKKSVNSVMNEKKLLAVLFHPFLVNMQYAFQDHDNLYLVMDLLTGGDLRYQLGINRFFSEEQTKFFIACLITGLEYIHVNGIIHRDIKPENLVLDSRGYLRITDFGISRIIQPDNSKDTSGTPGYMAPEVICRQNHGVESDYFAVGVIAFECMTGRRPYNGKTRKEIRDAILAKQVQLKKSDIPSGWSLEAADFVNKLIQRKPAHRLGFNGPLEVKNHAWLKNFPWQNLYEKSLKAPFVPNQNGENFNSKIFNHQIWNDVNPEVLAQCQKMLLDESVQNLFKNYSFDITQKHMNQEENRIDTVEDLDQTQIVNNHNQKNSSSQVKEISNQSLMFKKQASAASKSSNVSKQGDKLTYTKMNLEPEVSGQKRINYRF